MKFTVLGSGSTGNAVLIATEKTKVLVDAGMSAREICRRLAAMGVDAAELDGVLITHEHSDHVGGLRSLLAKIRCPVYISGETEEAYYWQRPRNDANGNGSDEGTKRRDALKDRRVMIGSTEDFRIGDIDFEPFTVPHDAVDNFGFVAKSGGVRVATLTDFGHVTQLIREKLRNCDGIVIESNHSRDMLRACPVYSWNLKQRIAGRRGHLSNEDLADWLQNDFDGTARHIVLAHLSQRANDIHLARITAETALKMRMPLFQVETQITLSSHLEPTEWIGF
ncbi:MAG: MBL fold metallo-hydrolase [Acidobacteria bacterium]|nr:MBL fold metallo-hydrolase [Acidobacteriota bacterium]